MKLIKVKPGPNKFKLVIEGKKTKLGEIRITYNKENKICNIDITNMSKDLAELSISDGRML